MDTEFCPNHNDCQIINIEGFVSNPGLKEHFVTTFCRSGNKNWSNCKRFTTKKLLHLCPDFVLPDSTFTVSEILDRLESE